MHEENNMKTTTEVGRPVSAERRTFLRVLVFGVWPLMLLTSVVSAIWCPSLLHEMVAFTSVFLLFFTPPGFLLALTLIPLVVYVVSRSDQPKPASTVSKLRAEPPLTLTTRDYRFLIIRTLLILGLFILALSPGKRVWWGYF